MYVIKVKFEIVTKMAKSKTTGQWTVDPENVLNLFIINNIVHKNEINVFSLFFPLLLRKKETLNIL